ncbi:hypothetical protein M0657_010361 [Pyricularia oryzae]|nr:hypothetical protein M0657_010361 [Pyricularia oryzae]KAI7922077.1 hypothetical protein M9X92_005067 [Pyricularia oryzae]
MRSQALLAVLYASGAIAGGGTYIPKDPALAHRAPEKFPWSGLLNNPFMTKPVIWYQIGQIKIWTDTRDVTYVRDGTKFDTYDHPKPDRQAAKARPRNIAAAECTINIAFGVLSSLATLGRSRNLARATMPTKLAGTSGGEMMVHCGSCRESARGGQDWKCVVIRWQ